MFLYLDEGDLDFEEEFIDKERVRLMQIFKYILGGI